MNFLISKVHKDSQFIAFLEWDDIFTSDNLQKKMQIFSQYPEVQMVYNNLDFIDENGEVFHRNFLQKSPYFLKNQKLSEDEFFKYDTWYGSYSSLMFRREVLQDLKIKNPTMDILFSVSDWDLFFRTVTKYFSYWLAESLTLYRRHTGNFSANNIKIFSDLRLQLQYYFDNNMIIKKSFCRHSSLISLFCSVSYIEKWERKKAWSYFLQAIKYHFFAYFTYKIWIFVLLFSPTFLQKMIIKMQVKR